MKFLEDLFRQLNSNNIHYSVLRNYELLPESTGESDIDVWVHAKDVAKFYSILINCTINNRGKVVSFIDKLFDPKICVMGANWGCQFDIFKGFIPFKKYILMSGDIVWDNTIDNYGVNVLDKRIGDILAFLKEVLNNGNLNQKPEYYIKAQNAINSLNRKNLSDCLKMFNTEFIDKILQVGKKDESQEFIKAIHNDGIKGLKKNKVCGSIFLSKFHRLFKKPGYTLAVLGTDGAGKSTIIEGINPYLEGAFHHCVIYNHLRPNAIPDIGVLLGKKNINEHDIVNSNPHGEKSSGFFGSLIRWGYYLIDYTFGYAKIVLKKIHTHSSIFIFDRYYYDYYIDPLRSKTVLPNWIFRIGEFFVPSPDIILCLGGSPKKIYERKPETSFEEVSKQSERLRKFCKRRNNAFWIDTTGDKELSINNAMKVIISVMERRYPIDNRL